MVYASQLVDEGEVQVLGHLGENTNLFGSGLAASEVNRASEERVLAALVKQRSGSIDLATLLDAELEVEGNSFVCKNGLQVVLGLPVNVAGLRALGFEDELSVEVGAVDEVDALDVFLGVRSAYLEVALELPRGIPRSLQSGLQLVVLARLASLLDGHGGIFLLDFQFQFLQSRFAYQAAGLSFQGQALVPEVVEDVSSYFFHLPACFLNAFA